MLHTLAWISLATSFLCMIVIAVDLVRHPQKMAIMNLVWPITALYFSVFALWAYRMKGRSMTRNASHTMPMEQDPQQPTLSQIALAASHCGAGCVLADIVTEFAVFASGATLFGVALYASFAWDLAAAWLLGIAFQYFSIQPMQHLPAGKAILAAIKADTFSIVAYQVGMYSWMALVYFKLFAHPHLEANRPEYWLMMQIAMICGYITALPMNWLLVRLGWKEAMG